MRRDGDSEKSDYDDGAEVEALSAFLPYIPLPIQKRFLKTHSGIGLGGVKGKGRKEFSRGASKALRLERLKSYIFARLVKSSIPLQRVHDLARKTDFDGLPILVEAIDRITENPLFQSRDVAKIQDDLLYHEEGEDGSGRVEGPSSLDLPGGLDDESSLSHVFEKLFSILGERRPEQLDMAKAVLNAFSSSSILIVEAGTGTGKSLAYLVPAIMHAVSTEGRVVISTYTKNLQNQLFTKDIPVAVDVIGVKVEAARLMGRENYICTERAIRLINRIADDNPVEALGLALSVILSDEGLVYSLPGIMETGIQSRLIPPKRCLMGQCFYADRCPLMIARNRAQNASIVLVNHSLVMTDYQSDRAMLGEYSCIIFDEAHNIEKAAIENLSIGFSKSLFKEVLEPLDFIKKQDDRWKLLCSFLQGGIREKRDDILDSMRGLNETLSSIFEQVASQYNDDGTYRNVKTRYVDGARTFENLKSLIVSFIFECNRLQRLLNPIVEANLGPEAQQVQRGVSFVCDGIDSVKSTLEYLTSSAGDDYVFWFDWGVDGGLREIAASPLFVDRSFADFLEGMCDSAVFTSATLSQGGNFRFFIRRLGLDKVGTSIEELSIPSPFPFDENCGIFIAGDTADPNDESFARRIADVVEKIARSVGKRILVLFTSYRMCRTTVDSISDPEVKRKLIVQGDGESREVLAEKLRRSKGGVLMGVASFWEGIDFPGEELEVLVITKIPFLVPTEPIVEARSQKLESMGENPFEVMQVPEAALRMKQGVGRLIRRKDDRGVVVLLDSRLVKKRYGEVILKELPASRVEILPMEEIPGRVVKWFTL